VRAMGCARIGLNMLPAAALETRLILVACSRPPGGQSHAERAEGFETWPAESEEAHPMADGKAEDPTAPCRRFAQRVRNESRLQATRASTT